MEDVERARWTAALAKGDTEAFDKLIQAFGPRMIRVATTLLGNSVEAEDAVQDVLLSLVRSRGRLASVKNLSAYLLASLRRAVSRRIESRHKQALTMRGWSAEKNRPGECRHSIDAGQRLRELVALLPADQREVLALHLDGEMTFREIAELTGVSQNTVASRYRYALEKLRDALRRETE